MRLIDADELITILDEELQEDRSLPRVLLVGFGKQILNDAPTVDAEPIRHGRWEDRTEDEDGIYEFCSVCHNDVDITHYGESYAYCPYCGAKMDLNDTYSTGHNEDETVTSEEAYLTECDKCEFRNKCLTQKLYWKDKNGREHIKTVFECPYEYLCEVTE